jgi:hypothetical protein
VMEKRKVRISLLRRRAEVAAPWTRIPWIMPALPPKRGMAKIPQAKEGGAEAGIAAGKSCVVDKFTLNTFLAQQSYVPSAAGEKGARVAVGAKKRGGEVVDRDLAKSLLRMINIEDEVSIGWREVTFS